MVQNSAYNYRSELWFSDFWAGAQCHVNTEKSLSVIYCINDERARKTGRTELCTASAGRGGASATVISRDPVIESLMM